MASRYYWCEEMQVVAYTENTETANVHGFEGINHINDPFHYDVQCLSDIELL